MYTTGRQTQSKTLAHSASLLASDAYSAGMSSDSELSSASRHHPQRTYMSQSRVYHAHPAPRGSHGSLSGVHYADAIPTGSGASNFQTSGGNKSLASLQQQQQQQQQPQSTPYLPHQSSVSSSGSGASSSASGVFHGLPPAVSGSPISPIVQQQQQQQQQQANRHHTGAGSRQLPARPFKQSMSIDHHQSVSQQQHYQPIHQQQSLAGHLASPAQSRSPLFEASDVLVSSYHHPSQAYQQQQQQVQAYPVMAHEPAMEPNEPPLTFEGQHRNFRFEMDYIEKQAAQLNLYERDQGVQQQQPIIHRRLPAIDPLSNSVSIASDAHYQQQQQQMPDLSLAGASTVVDPIEASQQQQHQQLQKHPRAQSRKQDIHSIHQMSSSPVDWLPPSNANSNINRPPSAVSQQKSSRVAGQHMKQTMSTDHYSSAIMSYQHQHQASQQQQSSHLSPTRSAAHLANASDHYTRGSMGYASPTMQGYELAARQPAYSSHIDHHGDLLHQKEPTHQTTGVSSNYHGGSTSALASYGQSSSSTSRGAASSSHHHQQQQQSKNKFEKQTSSGSSNSQSSSLKSSNLDISRSYGDNQQQPQQKFTNQSHNQQSSEHKGDTRQPKQGLLKKGYTSATSGYNDGNLVYSESGDLSSHHSNTYSSSANPSRHSAGLRAVSPQAPYEATTSSSSSHPPHLPSSSLRESSTRSESTSGLLNGMNNASNLTKKSNSANQLSMTGAKKRLGFRRKQVTSFSVHRSEEVAPVEARHLVKQGSSVSEGDSSMSGDSSSRSWSNSNFKQQTPDELASMNFIEGLGRGQMISRQGLASPYLGDIQLSLCDRRGNLEIEVIRARNLQAKSNKILPLTYVKLYLVKNRKCLAKAKTTLSNKRTLDPLFQQQLTFHEDYHGCILQSIVWGNFGKMDKKNFMGIAQISIDDLELSDTVISWYKLFLPSSLQTLPSKSLRHTLLSNSTESFTNTNNS